jgi:hypothetical protein
MRVNLREIRAREKTISGKTPEFFFSGKKILTKKSLHDNTIVNSIS